MPSPATSPINRGTGSETAENRSSGASTSSSGYRGLHHHDDEEDDQNANGCRGRLQRVADSWWERHNVTPSELVEAWRGTLRDTPPRRIAFLCATSVVLIASQVSLALGINLMLHSITYGSSNYVSNLWPALVWAVLYVLPCAVYHLYRGWRPWWYLWPRRSHGGHRRATDPEDHMLLQRGDAGKGKESSESTSRFAAPVTLFGLGLIDSLGGFTATYASPHTPVFLQTLLVSGGVVVAFLFTRLLVPVSADAPKPRLNPINTCAFLLSITGTIVAGATEADTIKEGSNIGWLLIYLGAAVIPPIYNVMQGRFLRLLDRAQRERLLDKLDDEQLNTAPPPPASPAADGEDSDWISIKLTMLSGDSVGQLIWIVVLFPLDFTPWFGSFPNKPAESWKGMTEATECIWGRCDATVGYFFMYTMAMYVNHLTVAVMNHVSTTLTPFILSLAVPIQLLLLYGFPTLNVWGNRVSLRNTLICFACSLGAAVLFFLSEQARKRHATKQLELLRDEVDTGGDVEASTSLLD